MDKETRAIFGIPESETVTDYLILYPTKDWDYDDLHYRHTNKKYRTAGSVASGVILLEATKGNLTPPTAVVALIAGTFAFAAEKKAETLYNDLQIIFSTPTKTSIINRQQTLIEQGVLRNPAQLARYDFNCEDLIIRKDKVSDYREDISKQVILSEDNSRRNSEINKGLNEGTLKDTDIITLTLETKDKRSRIEIGQHLDLFELPIIAEKLQRILDAPKAAPTQDNAPQNG